MIMMGMNDKPLRPGKYISSFFYENKLYEFSQKELSSENRVRMKKLAETLPEARHEIGRVLLALEYLQKLSNVSLEIKNINYKDLGKRRRYWCG